MLRNSVPLLRRSSACSNHRSLLGLRQAVAHIGEKCGLIHCSAAGHALIQQLIGPVQQAVVLVPEIEGIVQGVDGREPTAAVRAGDFFTLIFPADFQRSAAYRAFLQKISISRHRRLLSSNLLKLGHRVAEFSSARPWGNVPNRFAGIRYNCSEGNQARFNYYARASAGVRYPRGISATHCKFNG